MEFEVMVKTGRITGTFKVKGRVNFGDVIGEAIGAAQIHLHNVVLEGDLLYSVAYSIGEGKGPQLYLTMGIHVVEA